MNVPAVGQPDRELARYCLTVPIFDAKLALSEHGSEHLQATREALHQQLLPLAKQEPGLKGGNSDELRKCLKLIGAAMMPTMSSNQADAWIGALAIKFSDLPARCITQAANEAVHQSFAFPADAELAIRTKATELKFKQQRALARLDLMQAELHRRMHPEQRQLEGPTEPVPDEDVHRWQQTALGRSVIRLGLAAGYIQPSQLAEPLPPEEEHGHA